jgi:membrane protein DedA with SNARE-associated domain
MDVEALIQEHGYLAIFFASMMEGEMVQVSGGIAARAGLLQWHWAVLIGALGTFLATQPWFFAGRYASDRLLRYKPGLEPRVEQARALLERHGVLLFVFYRFMYGLRTVVPLALGMSGVSPVRFMVVDALSWLLWFSVVASLGFYMGDRAMQGLQWVLANPAVLPVVLVAILFVGWLTSRVRASRA